MAAAMSCLSVGLGMLLFCMAQAATLPLKIDVEDSSILSLGSNLHLNASHVFFNSRVILPMLGKEKHAIHAIVQPVINTSHCEVVMTTDSSRSLFFYSWNASAQFFINGLEASHWLISESQLDNMLFQTANTPAGIFTDDNGNVHLQTGRNGTIAINNTWLPLSNCAGSWTSWSSCSVPCGGGTQTRTYSVKTSSFRGGNSCPNSLETRACGSDNCLFQEALSRSFQRRDSTCSPSSIGCDSKTIKLWESGDD